MNKIVLASGSPRRKEILSKYIDDFEIIPSDIEEVIDDKPPVIQAMALAFEKGLDISEKVSDDSIIISADTIVVYDNKILGKPKDDKEAFQMIKSLSGTNHEVITGFAIIKKSEGIKIIDNSISVVNFKTLRDAEIEKYISKGESLDKAGAYGIQGYGGLLVNEIKGDYYNIVGLPISKIRDCLLKHFSIDLL